MVALSGLVTLAGGCQIIAGIGGEEPKSATGGAGGSTTEGGGGATLPMGACTPKETQACYSGPKDSEGVGLCKGGVVTCGEDGMWGTTCDGEVPPAAEDCSLATDENCDTYDCVVWQKTFTNNVQSGAIGIDGQGIVYVGVGFSAGIDFGDGKPVVPQGENDMAILAYDKTGKLLWVKAFPQSGGQYLGQMVVDKDGNIAIGGTTDQPLTGDFGSLPAGQFVAKLDSTGKVLWATGVAGLAYITNLAYDSKGNVYAAGGGQTVDIGTGLLDGGDTGNFWIAKLDAGTGVAAWAKITKYGKTESLSGLAVDPSDSAVVTGMFDGTYLGLSGDAGVPSDVYNCCGAYAPFLMRIDPNGLVSDGKALAGFTPPINVYVTGVANDPFGTSMIAGYFSGKVDFQSGEYDSGQDTTMFILRDQTSGFQQTAKVFLQPGIYSSPNTIAMDSHENVVMHGYYQGALDLGGGPLPENKSVFVTKLDKTGAFLWARTFKFGDGGINGMAVGPGEDETALLGNFYGGIDLGFGPVPGNGMFILRLGK